MQDVVKDPYNCILVVAAYYRPGFAQDVADLIQQQCGGKFSEVVLCEDNAEERLKDLRARTGGKGGQKIVMVLQSGIGGDAVRFLCGDDADKPLEERRVAWIHSIAVGLDYYRLFDCPDIISYIPITNGKQSQSRALAEHVLYAIGYFNRRTWEWIEKQRERRWHKYSIQEMYGQKCLIMGYGDIGENTATLAKAYGMDVTAIKRSLPKGQTASPFVDRLGVTVYAEHGPTGTGVESGDTMGTNESFAAERARLIAESDYIVNIMPGTPETMKLFNKDVFATMKPSALYINIGRGCTNNETDLVQALTAGTIRGAAVDVFDVEPLPSDSPLWEVPEDKLMLTSHTAAQTQNQISALIHRFVSLADRWQRGEEIYSEEVNRQFWY